MRLVVQEAVGAGVSELPGELGRCQAQVQGHEHRTGADDSVYGDYERRTVASEHADDLARLHALAPQVRRCRIDGGV